ncbi:MULTISPECIES: MFS transporter [Ramlibacter]|uniref:MFS transporter n=1 Tax=Ramlibacter aquaticus TaxID=2780094 RepID=A0ABR9SBD5_9BURK|nr:MULTISPECIES: MFS transporter [Ramlibacter]MBE7939601.1 MFS transporter [Ramlibacter aquaticus]
MSGPRGAELPRLIAGQVFLHACMAGTRMAVPLLALRDGYGEAAVGALLALFALTQVFLALPAGRYADRHGLRRPMAICVTAAVLGAGLAAAFPVFPVLCLAALLTGGAAGGAVISLQRHVGRAASSPTELKQVFSWLAIGPAISNFIGPLAAGLAIDHGGFRLAFGLMALLPLLCWFFVRRATDLPPVAVPPGQGRARAWDLLAEPGFRRLLFVNWILASCWDVHTLVVPVLGHERGLSASVIGSILGAFAVAATLVRVALPVVAARVREAVVVTAAMAATAALFAIYPLMNVALSMGLCSVLLGAALGCVQPMIMSTLHQITPEHRHGEAVAMRIMAINASSVAMPMLFGAAGSVIGIAGVFWIVGGVVGLGTRLALGLGRGARAH